LSAPKERRTSTAVAPSSPLKDYVDSPGIPSSSSSSSSSLSDADHPAHRSQLFKRPPRFKQQRPRDLSTFEEGDGAQDIDDSGSHGAPSLPFASAARRPANTKHAQDTLFRASSKPEQKIPQAGPSRDVAHTRQRSIDQQSQATTETASSMTTSTSGSDAPAPSSTSQALMSPVSDHRAAMGRLGSPRQRSLRSTKEGSEGTPSMGSSFSDIDGMCADILNLKDKFTDRTRCGY
jgi:hypothetical protein